MIILPRACELMIDELTFSDVHLTMCALYDTRSNFLCPVYGLLQAAPTALQGTGFCLTTNLPASNRMRDYGVVPGSLQMLPMYMEQ